MVSMGQWFLRPTVKILAILQQTVNPKWHKMTRSRKRQFYRAKFLRLTVKNLSIFMTNSKFFGRSTANGQSHWDPHLRVNSDNSSSRSNGLRLKKNSGEIQNGNGMRSRWRPEDGNSFSSYELEKYRPTPFHKYLKRSKMIDPLRICGVNLPILFFNC